MLTEKNYSSEKNFKNQRSIFIQWPLLFKDSTDIQQILEIKKKRKKSEIIKVGKSSFNKKATMNNIIKHYKTKI